MFEGVKPLFEGVKPLFEAFHVVFFSVLMVRDLVFLFYG